MDREKETKLVLSLNRMQRIKISDLLKEGENEYDKIIAKESHIGKKKNSRR